MKGFVTTAGVIILAVLIAAVSAGAEEKMKSRTPSQLKVSGTKILDAGGKEVKLRGVNAASLEWTSDGEGHILETIRVAIRDWKVNCIRLPLSQDRWFGKAPEQKGEYASYRELVRKAVDLCSSNGCYVILDLHWSTAGQPWGTNIGQHSMPDNHSADFWVDIAEVYANHPAVIFDLYNEPHDVSWDVWLNGGTVQDRPNGRGQERVTFQAVGMQALLDTVRGTDAKNVVIAGGLDWAYDMSGFLQGYQLKDPDGNGVIYANHVYDNKRQSVFKWAADMEKASAVIPVIVSEFGGSGGPDRKTGWWGASPAAAMGDDWLLHVLQVIQDNDWSFTAWDLHPAAGPCLISNWSYAPTADFGVYVKKLLTKGKLPRYTPPDLTKAGTKINTLPSETDRIGDARIYGDWKLASTPGVPDSLLAFSTGEKFELVGQWIDARGVSELEDVGFSAGKVRFSQTVVFDGEEFKAVFDGTIAGDSLTGTFTHGGARDKVEANRVPEIRAQDNQSLSALVGSWNLEIKNEWGVTKQRLKVYPDMSGLYGTIPVKKIVLEAGDVSFTIVRQWGDRKFEMNFKGKLNGPELVGEITSSRGAMQVSGKKSK